MNDKRKSLDQRFKEFLDTLVGLENIDNLTLDRTQSASNKADYFTEKRQLIIELKSLETDTEYKIEKILEPHRSRPEFPVVLGAWELNKILKFLPDGKEINRQITDAVTSSLEEIYKKANRQIRTTKTTFNLSDSQGLLIILNEKINVLSPPHLDYKLRKLVAKRNPDGSFRFPEINHILIFSEAHFSLTKDKSTLLPIIHLPVNTVCEFQYNDFVEFLTKKWAEYNKAAFISSNEKIDLKKLNLKSVAQHQEENKKLIPRHESWRRYYRKFPYFRSYDEKKLIWMFEMIMSEATYGMLKGATQKQESAGMFWMEVFTHFLEEINHRGIDFRTFSPVAQKMGTQIEEEMKKRFPEESI